jgi:hypothetical protein
MASLNLITSNPVMDAYDRRTALTNQQAQQDLANAAARQQLAFDAQANPIRLRDINSTADINAANAEVAGATKRNRIDQSGYDTRKSQLGVQYDEATLPSRISEAGSNARTAAANADVAAGTVAPRISLAGSQAAEGAANARVAQGTVGSRIAEAGSNAATSAANARVAQDTVGSRINLAAAQAKVAQNAAQYDKEGRWFDLFSKNPQLAITQAGQYGVPAELLAAAQDQAKAAWMQQAWSTIEAQYPGEQNAALRAAVFEQQVRAAGSNPSAASAMTVPEGAPPPQTRQDELRQQAADLKLIPGSRDYVNFIASDGKTLPGDKKIITLYDPGGKPRSMREDDPSIDQLLQNGWTSIAPKSGAVLTQVGTDANGQPVFDYVATAPKLTEDQSKAMNFASRMEASSPIIDKFEQQGADYLARAANSLPGGLGNYMQTPEFQQYTQAKEDFLRAVLRKESGAVISNEEMVGGDRQYFPAPGDSPAVIAQKRQNRRVALEAMKSAAGPGATLIPGIIDRAVGEPAAPSAAATSSTPHPSEMSDDELLKALQQ